MLEPRIAAISQTALSTFQSDLARSSQAPYTFNGGGPHGTLPNAPLLSAPSPTTGTKRETHPNLRLLHPTAQPADSAWPPPSTQVSQTQLAYHPSIPASLRSSRLAMPPPGRGACVESSNSEAPPAGVSAPLSVPPNWMSALHIIGQSIERLTEALRRLTDVCHVLAEGPPTSHALEQAVLAVRDELRVLRSAAPERTATTPPISAKARSSSRTPCKRWTKTKAAVGTGIPFTTRVTLLGTTHSGPAGGGGSADSFRGSAAMEESGVAAEEDVLFL